MQYSKKTLFGRDDETLDLQYLELEEVLKLVIEYLKSIF